MKHDALLGVRCMDYVFNNPKHEVLRAYVIACAAGIAAILLTPEQPQTKNEGISTGVFKKSPSPDRP